MGVKEKIHIEIDSMARNELALLYEQIKLIKKMKKSGEKDRDPITIEEERCQVNYFSGRDSMKVTRIRDKLKRNEKWQIEYLPPSSLITGV